MINPFKRTYSAEESKTFYFLAQIPLFADLSNDEMANFLPFMYLRKYKENEVVFFRNDPSHALYLINNGMINLFVDVKGQEESLAYLKKGQSFGTNAMLTSTKRNYNAVVVSEEAELYVVPHANVQSILNDHPRIKAKIMTRLARLQNEYIDELFESYREVYGFFNLASLDVVL
jgi:CRP/FNR family transcriptional regulator, cyclic AMP receptor protein